MRTKWILQETLPIQKKKAFKGLNNFQVLWSQTVEEMEIRLFYWSGKKKSNTIKKISFSQRYWSKANSCHWQLSPMILVVFGADQNEAKSFFV